MFKRTEGVSTTDIVGKLLLLTKDNHGSGRARGASFDRPLRSSDYVKEIRRIEDEERKAEDCNVSSPLKQAANSNVPNLSFLATP